MKSSTSNDEHFLTSEVELPRILVGKGYRRIDLEIGHDKIKIANLLALSVCPKP
jgi:hypothetical protein